MKVEPVEPLIECYKRTPRTLNEAFGPHATLHTPNDDLPAVVWRPIDAVIAVVCAIIVVATLYFYPYFTK